MGLAPLAHLLWQYTMKFSPKNPDWFNRDRFVLSNGHACVLQYIMLHLYGYGYTMDDLKSFRQLGSKLPGHPEAEMRGIEVTTGPLGQGISNAVGLAIAEKHLAATFNRPGFDIINNRVFVILGDGCLMEGVSFEALSLAGHLQLDNLIAFYDDNKITIDGDTAVAFTEDVTKRMEALGWHVLFVENGDTDIQELFNAIEKAKIIKGKPTMIRVKTTIGYGSKLAGTHSVHGSPLKPDDIAQLKKKLGFDPEKSFFVPENVAKQCAARASEGDRLEKEWNELLNRYEVDYPKEASELKRRIAGHLPNGWEKELPVYTPQDKAIASRKLSEALLIKIHSVLPELVGGSADLTGSNLTRWTDAVDFQAPSTKLGDYSGRYIRYGVREHGMSAIMNGIAAYGGLIPYGGTFLNFVSYAVGAVRLAALSGYRAIWVATHDSIGLGEDGPTHQPIETLSHLRAIPNLMVWRPADGNETSAAYKVSLESKNTPSVIALSRQDLNQLQGSSIEKASKGAYILRDAKDPELIIAATGSEVGIAVQAADILEKESKRVRVVSVPDFYTFDQQGYEYKLEVFPAGVPALSFEALSEIGWHKYTHEHFNLDHFGASGPYKELYDAFGFTPEGVAKRGLATIEFYKDYKVPSCVEHAFKKLTQKKPGSYECSY